MTENTGVTPFVSVTCQGERCWCGEPAVRKVGEEIPCDDPMPRRHNLTSYICARHYAQLMGPLGAEHVGLSASSPNHADTGLVERAAKAFEAEALVVASEREGEQVHLQPGLDDMEPDMREAFYRCLRAALASIPDLERTDAMREAAVGMVAAWESLPGPKHYSADEVQRWISQQMKPAIDKVRKALSGDKA